MDVCTVCEFGSKIRPRPFACIALGSAFAGYFCFSYILQDLA